MIDVLKWTSTFVAVIALLFIAVFVGGWGTLTLLKYAHIYNTINFKNIMVCGLAVCAILVPIHSNIEFNKED